MTTLQGIILQKKQEIAKITENPTLSAFDNEYCERLDKLATTDSFIAKKIREIIKELNSAGRVDYNDHYRTAYNNYNEAVCYYELKNKGFKISNIPGSRKQSTPDFEIEFSYDNWSGEEENVKIYIEVKSLSFANGNNLYKEIQEKALNCNIELEEQRKKGKQICTTILEISPLGYNGCGLTFEIEEINKKINNNIKPKQYQYGKGEDTILLIDSSQYIFPFKLEDCLPIYPNIENKCCVSGRLWMLAFGKKNERIFGCPEFEGKCCFDKDLEHSGILVCNDNIKGIIFTSGTSYSDKVFYGFYRYNDRDLAVVPFLSESCNFVNDDLNTFGFKVYEKNMIK